MLTVMLSRSGLTSILQVLDRSVNGPIEKGMQQRWSVWMQEQVNRNDSDAVTKSGNLRKPSIGQVLSWLADTIGTISRDLIARAFKYCGITNNLDGTEDDLIYEKGDQGGHDKSFDDEDAMEVEVSEESHLAALSSENDSSNEEEGYPDVMDVEKEKRNVPDHRASAYFKNNIATSLHPATSPSPNKSVKKSIPIAPPPKLPPASKHTHSGTKCQQLLLTAFVKARSVTECAMPDACFSSCSSLSSSASASSSSLEFSITPASPRPSVSSSSSSSSLASSSSSYHDQFSVPRHLRRPPPPENDSDCEWPVATLPASPFGPCPLDSIDQLHCYCGNVTHTVCDGSYLSLLICSSSVDCQCLHLPPLISIQYFLIMFVFCLCL
jgi:hypothetical protein